MNKYDIFCGSVICFYIPFFFNLLNNPRDQALLILYKIIVLKIRL